jgi:2-oxo-4-hydroxy-4-carboxy-5-ureidoimidazoline decarboxylase
MSRTRPGIPRFNRLPEDEARAELATCLDVPRWADDILAGRPYGSLGEIEAVAGPSADAITDDELEAALARHPRIGERAAAGHDAAFSEKEQSGLDPRDVEVAERLVAGNRAYEEKFDRVFLIRASGRDSHEILRELERRLRNDDVTEREETVNQLRQIALLRLSQILA